VNGFWTIQQVFAFIIAATAAATILWRVVVRLFHQSTTTHAKIDAIEDLLEQVNETGMTAGAEDALLRLERRLLLTQAQVRLVMEVDGTGYVETNKEGGLIYCNTQFVHWTGMSIDDAKGYGWASAIHPDDRARVVNDWTNAVKEQRPIDLWYRYKYNSVITSVHARSVVVRDEHNDNETLGFVAIIVPVISDTNTLVTTERKL
jgi:PAS domain S-box-containing protein